MATPNPNLVDLTTAAETFAQVAEMEYQNGQYLVGIGEDRNMLGTSLEIPVIDRVALRDRGFTSGDLPITNIGSRAVQLVPQDFALKSAVGDSNATLFAYDKILYWSKAHVEGAARTIDDVKLSAITDSTNFNPANNNQVAKNPSSTANTGTGINYYQLVEAQTLLEENGYDIRSNLFLVGNARAIKNIFKDPQFTDWDYNPARELTQAPIRQFETLLGYSVRKLGAEGSNVIGMDSGTGRETKVYAIAQDAIVNGYSKHLHSEIVSEPQNLRTSIVTGLTMGSTIVHPGGIIEITVDTDPQFP